MSKRRTCLRESAQPARRFGQHCRSPRTASSFEPLAPTGSPGTKVTAVMQPDKPVHVDQAQAYIAQFVAYLPTDVYVNGTKASGQPIEESVPAFATRTWSVEQAGSRAGWRHEGRRGLDREQ